MKAKFKVAFVGNGKLTKALISGFLISGFLPEEIVVIKKEDSTSDFSWYKERTIFISADMQYIADAPAIVLAVLPQGSGNILSRMSRVTFDENIRYEIISFVSGLTSDEIRRSNIRISKGKLIRGTCNINVANAKGTICLNTGSSLFAPIEGGVVFDEQGVVVLSKRYYTYRSVLGTVVFSQADRMHFMVVAIGSAPAIDYKKISMLYESRITSENNTDVSFFEWLMYLNNYLKEFAFSYSSDPEEQLVVEYLLAKAEILANTKFQFNRRDARELGITTFKSCVESLLTIGPNVSLADIDKLITKIATKGGITEEGLDIIGSFEKVDREIFAHAFHKMLERSSNLKFCVDESIKEAMLIWL